MRRHLARLADGATGAAAIAEWTTVVLLGASPVELALTACATVASTPADCVAELGGTYRQIADSARTAIADQSRLSAATYLDTSSWFCDAQGRRPPVVGTSAVPLNGTHLTPQQTTALGPLLAVSLTPRHENHDATSLIDEVETP